MPTPVPPSSWRRIVAFWPIAVRQAWASLVARHEDSGLPWNEAEFKAFLWICNDLERHDIEHPNRPIVYTEPEQFPEVTDWELQNCTYLPPPPEPVQAKASFPVMPDINEEEREKIKKAADDAAKILKLQKEGTKKKTSVVKREKPVEVEAKPKKSRKKGKFDEGMGALFLS